MDQGLADGRISEKAAEEVAKHLDDAMERYREGHTDEAIGKLDDLESKLDDLRDHSEVAPPEENRLDRALEDLALAMFEAQPPDEDDDD